MFSAQCLAELMFSLDSWKTASTFPVLENIETVRLHCWVRLIDGVQYTPSICRGDQTRSHPVFGMSFQWNINCIIKKFRFGSHENYISDRKVAKIEIFEKIARILLFRQRISFPIAYFEIFILYEAHFSIRGEIGYRKRFFQSVIRYLKQFSCDMKRNPLFETVFSCNLKRFFLRSEAKSAIWIEIRDL